ncbi:hypothetical protein B6U67_04355 [Methanosarcinales archaeon ex4484_138]|nr:MAG: hypothetical protein B6U67_04355 [Methanosarcinales archaeon ex4484_138]
MTRDEIAGASYVAAEKLVKLKIENEIVEEDSGTQTIQLIKEARQMVESGEGTTESITMRETVPDGDLYPSKNLHRLEKHQTVSYFS